MAEALTYLPAHGQAFAGSSYAFDSYAPQQFDKAVTGLYPPTHTAQYQGNAG